MMSRIPLFSSAASLALVVAAAFVLSGCPRNTNCANGLSACGSGAACVDFTSDSRNCGSCGASCQPGQACVNSACVCQVGTELCSGTCAVTASDSKNCGGCGNVCPGNQVCEAGQCRATCILGSSSLCGSSCVDLTSDSANCGACGKACTDNQSCRGGQCSWDVVAACSSVGQVVGLQAATGNPGPATPVGTFPQALAAYRDAVLAADGLENKLRNLRLPAFSEAQTALTTSASPNHIFIERPYVYLVNSSGNTLAVFQEETADAGTDAGTSSRPLRLLKEINLGANSSPQLVLKIGTTLYIPLYGTAAAPTAGGKVLTVNVTDPANPVAGAAIDLNGVNLKSFDGGSAVPFPYGLAARGNALYVALNNLDPSNFQPAGPGIVVKIDLANGNALTPIELPTDKCLNPGWTATSSDGASIYVSCIGRVVRDGAYKAVSSESAGILVLGSNDAVRTVWNAACPPGSNADGGCEPPSPGRFAVQGNRLFVADQVAGRVWLLEDNGTNLVERRGYADGGTPIRACSKDNQGFGLIGDVVAVP